MILDSLIYRDLFPLIESKMSDSNIGARKERNIRDHLFILYGIMNSVVHGGEESVDIQIYDVEKCFDKLWLEDCLLDLHDTLPLEGRNDKFSLIYKMNEDNFVAIKTTAGLTDRINLKQIVMQGGKWGPIKCSNTIDHIGKRFLKEDKHLYLYKGCVKILPLAMIDDLLVIAPCGVKSEDVNIELNAEIDMKKLHFHAPKNGEKSKCHFLHIGKSATHQHNLKVHGTSMEQVNCDTYLGDLISEDFKNTKNIDERVSKGVGIVGVISDLVKTVSFGTHFFEIAVTLRNAFLINGILTNSEVWYGLSKSDINKLENVDKLFLRKLFEVPTSCPTEAMYLELGCIPLGIIIQARRIRYLHHLVTREKKGMLSEFFYAQWNFPCNRKEWTEQVKEDLELFGLPNNLEWLEAKKKSSFKRIVNEKMKEVAFHSLINKKETHKKLEKLTYPRLEMQSYLKKGVLSVSEARACFKFRTRMGVFWENFKHSKLKPFCPCCDEDVRDTQRHSFDCKRVGSAVLINNQYEEIFETDIGKSLGQSLENILKYRENYL